MRSLHMVGCLSQTPAYTSGERRSDMQLCLGIMDLTCDISGPLFHSTPSETKPLTPNKDLHFLPLDPDRSLNPGYLAGVSQRTQKQTASQTLPETVNPATHHHHCALASCFAIRNLIISSACRAIYDSPNEPAVKDPLLTGRT